MAADPFDDGGQTSEQHSDDTPSVSRRNDPGASPTPKSETKEDETRLPNHDTATLASTKSFCADPNAIRNPSLDSDILEDLDTTRISSSSEQPPIAGISSARELLETVSQYQLLDPKWIRSLDETTCTLKELSIRLVNEGHLTEWQLRQVLIGQAADLRMGCYQLLDRIGEGGMGTVYRARNELIHRTVALKTLKGNLVSDGAAIERFLVEARTCIGLRHRNIVDVHDVGRDGERLYMIMALVDGTNLHEQVKLHGPLPARQAAMIIEQVANALSYAHGRGVVHRDIKPQNIMLTTRGRIKVLDMGLARLLSEARDDNDPPTYAGAANVSPRLTGVKQIMGTVTYMAPEQASDPQNVDGLCDIYSLGCTFYYLLTGRNAFVGHDVKTILDRHRRGEHQPIPEEIDSILRAHLLSMIAVSKEQRFQNARDVATAMREWRQLLRESPSSPIQNIDQLVDQLEKLRIIEPGSSPPVTNDRLQALAEWEFQGILTPFQAACIRSDAVSSLCMDKFVLLEPISQNFKGEMYRARGESNETVALRMLIPASESELAYSKMQPKLLTLTQLQNQILPKTLGYGCENGIPYLATQFIHGVDLRSRVNKERPLPEAYCLQWMLDILDVLSQGHAQGILHGDLKPSNLVETATGRYLMDFGLLWLFWDTAEKLDNHVTRSESEVLIGTPEVMAPEQWAAVNDLSPAVDIYSLGCTLFFLVVGEMPFTCASRRDYLFSHVASPPPRAHEHNGSVSKELSSIIEKMMAKRPENRFQNAAQLRILIEGLLEVEKFGEQGFTMLGAPSWESPKDAAIPAPKMNYGRGKLGEPPIAPLSRGPAAIFFSLWELVSQWVAKTPRPQDHENREATCQAVLADDRVCGRPAVTSEFGCYFCSEHTSNSTGSDDGSMSPTDTGAGIPAKNAPVADDAVALSGDTGAFPIVSVPAILLIPDDAGLEAIEVDKTPFTIGRGTNNDCFLEDRSLSRMHAKLLFDGNNWRVQDLRSRNGTFINGVTCTDSVVQAGDRLAFGSVYFTARDMKRATTFQDSRPDGVAVEMLPAEDDFFEVMPDELHSNAEVHVTNNGKFVVMETLGEGGFGKVCSGTYYRSIKSQAKTVGIPAAIKILSIEDIGRLVTEFRILKSVLEKDHRLVQLLDVGQSKNNGLLVMEFVEGETLTALVSRRGPLAIADAAQIVREVAGGLRTLHESSVVHRDVKPSNIMVNREGMVKVIDTGVSKLMESGKANNMSMTMMSSFVGTPTFMAPEQFADASAATAKTDIYGLAMTFYYLLTGRNAFEGNQIQEIMYKKVTSDPVPVNKVRKEIPQRLADLLRNMYARDEKYRPNAAEVEHALTAFVESR